MDKVVGFTGMIIGSSIGGWLGGKVGLMSAVILSAVGAGVGFYYSRRAFKNFLE